MKTIITILCLSLFQSIHCTAQIQNYGNLRMHQDATMRLLGNFTNNGTFDNNLGELHVVGNNIQTFDGSNLIQVFDLTIHKSSNVLQLNNELQIAGILTFSNGKILSEHADMATEFVHFLDGASYINASNASHIDGVVRKTGNDAFVFPTGDHNLLRIIGISEPSAINDHFTAYYSATDPALVYNSSALGLGLDHVSSCEYWILNRTGGSSAVEVTLSWGSNSCGVDTLCDLRVARWNGSLWTSEGNGGITGTEIAGTLVSGRSCDTADVVNFSPFTLASVSDYNDLPSIELMFFDAQKCNDEVCLSWQTATELNNDFFTVQRSPDAIVFEEVTRVTGAGNSLVTINYNAIDDNPFYGYSYYRLKQTDFSGRESLSLIRVVEFKGLNLEEVHAYPNPTSNHITIKAKAEELENCRIFTFHGLDITEMVKVISRGATKLVLDFSHLPAGIYTLRTKTTACKIQKQ